MLLISYNIKDELKTKYLLNPDLFPKEVIIVLEWTLSRFMRLRPLAFSQEVIIGYG